MPVSEKTTDADIALSPKNERTPYSRSKKRLLEQYQKVRETSEDICRPLEIEDYGVQTMDDVSPPKWHLAHTSWFFETFLLKPSLTRIQRVSSSIQLPFQFVLRSGGVRVIRGPSEAWCPGRPWNMCTSSGATSTQIWLGSSSRLTTRSGSGSGPWSVLVCTTNSSIRSCC